MLLVFLLAVVLQSTKASDFDKHSFIINRHAVGIVFRRKMVITPVDAKATLVFQIKLPQKPRIKRYNIDCQYLKEYWEQRHHHNIRHWEQELTELNRKNRRFLYRGNQTAAPATASPQALLAKPINIDGNATCDILSIIQRSIATDQEQLYRALNDIFLDIMSVTKGLLERNNSRTRRQVLIGLGAHIFGLANVYDIYKVESAINTLAETQEKQFATMKLHWNHILSLMKITDARIFSVNQHLRQHDILIEQMHTNFIENLELLEYVVVYLTRYIEHQQNATKLLLDLSVFRNSINDLLFGKLNPLLVRGSDIRDVLLQLDNYLIQQRLPYYIVQQNLYYYYKHASFFTWTAFDSLFIAVETPLSVVVHPLFVYSIQLLPLQLHSENNQAFMQLDLKYKAIAFNFEDDKYLLFEDSDDLPTDNQFDVSQSRVKWRHRQEDTCIWALLENRVKQIKMLCNYVVFQAPLPSNVYKITHNMILVHNINKTLLICDDNVTEITSDIPVHVQQINCECQLQIDQFYFPNVFDQCHRSNSTSIFLHTVNLRLLWEYFSEKELSFLSLDSILNHTVLVDVPSLIFGSEYSNSFLAIEESLKYQFGNVINASKSDVHRLTSIQNYLYEKLANLDMSADTFNLFNYWHLVQLAGVVFATIAFLISIYLFCRLKTMTAALVLAGKTTGNPAPVVLRVTTPAQTVYGELQKNSTSVYLEWLNRFRMLITEEDLLLILILLLIFTILIIFIFKLPKRRKFDTIKLVIDTGRQHLFFTLATLQYSADYYTIMITALNSKISLSGMCYTVLKLHVDDFSFLQKVTADKIKLKTKWHLSPYTAWKVRRIMSNDSYALLLMVADFSGKTLELLQLSAHHRNLENAYFQGSQVQLMPPQESQATAPPIYPMLPTD